MSGSEPDPLIAGRYRLGRRLGRGGMAEVFDAFDERLERPVALKVLRPEVAAEAPMRQRFEAEARAAARFSHPAVVSVYDSGEHAGRTFLIMERLPGETLADRIKRGPVDQRWLKQAATDVLSALSAAHQIGLIHRDIKPGNVLITEDDRVKVADFGIAKMAFGGGHDQDLTQVGMVLGTPAYLAPERLSGEPATAGTDLYALAVVLYEAATGHKPPAGAADATVVGTGAASAAAVAADPPLDPALARVIRRAMAPNPADRYPSAEAMAADLARGGGEAVPATVALPSTRLAEAVPAPTRVMGPLPAEPREVLREEIRSADPERRRALAVAAAILVVLIIVVVVALLLTRHHSSGSPSTTTPATVAPATAPSTASTTPTTSTPSSDTATTTSTTTPTTSTTSTTTPSTTSTTRKSTTTSSSSTTSTTSATGGAVGPGARVGQRGR